MRSNVTPIIYSIDCFRYKSGPESENLLYNCSMEKEPFFAVDIMLGKLAKWLRLMGFNTFYSNCAQDDFLMKLTVKEKRVLLTRDRSLASRLGSAAYFVENIFLPEQLKEVTTAFQLNRFHPTGRCSVCNGVLVSIPKSDVAGRVPPYVFRTEAHFFQCTECRKFYWEGTHVQGIKKMISETIGETDENNTISLEKADEQQEGR